MPTITDTLQLRCGAILANRIAKSATSEGLADGRGWPTRELDRLYSEWAVGGFGLIVVGNVIVDRHHLERPGNVVVDGNLAEAQLAGFRSWMSSARRGGAHVWAQLSHAGRRTHEAINAHPLSASAIKLDLPGQSFSPPDEILNAEMEWIVGKFAKAARFCKAAGFTGIQIQAGQGHLISSFLDPDSNQRKDQWGGSLENRARLLMAVVKATRSEVGAGFPIGVKLDATEFTGRRGGLAELERTIIELDAAGVDLLELCSDAHEGFATAGSSATQPTNDFANFVIALRRRLKASVLLTGGMRKLAAMQSALGQGVDMIGVARPVCVDPLAVKRLLAGENGELESWELRNQHSRGFGQRLSSTLFGRLSPLSQRQWFCAQLYRLGRGESAAPDLSAAQAGREVAKGERTLIAERNASGGVTKDAAADGVTKGPLLSVPASSPVPAGEQSARKPAKRPADLFKGAVMSAWYVYVKFLNWLWPSISIEGKRLTILPGVYKPLENEYACAQYCETGDRVLDLGSGSGVCSIFCAPIAREVFAVDISAAAVRNTELNCQQLGLANVVARQSDMFDQVEGRFDLILANAPYFAADFENEEEQFATSVRYLPILFAEAKGRLTPNGRLLVQFPMWFRKRIETLADRHGLQVVSVRRLPRKSLGLSLLSLAYLQVGFRSAYYLIRPLPSEKTKLAA